jgi:putative restriction endonuclease
MIESAHVVDRFRTLAVWSNTCQRAPHKPLLCLLGISNLLNGKERLLPFAVIEEPLSALLMEFGPPRKVCHPEYPFWSLQNDERIWEVRLAIPIDRRTGVSPTKAALLRARASGGFTEEVFRTIRDDEESRTGIIMLLLESHFPQSIHEDILDSLGLSLERQLGTGKQRDPQFREKILAAYEYRCAICGFNVRIGHLVVALEAAHIKWHQAGGPDIHENGLALCSLHHKLFDRGAFTVGLDHRAVVSERAYGTDGFSEHLGRYHKQGLLKPTRESYRPSGDFLDWHMTEVFLSPGRE